MLLKLPSNSCPATQRQLYVYRRCMYAVETTSPPKRAANSTSASIFSFCVSPAFFRLHLSHPATLLLLKYIFPEADQRCPQERHLRSYGALLPSHLFDNTSIFFGPSKSRNSSKRSLRIYARARSIGLSKFKASKEQPASISCLLISHGKLAYCISYVSTTRVIPYRLQSCFFLSSSAIRWMSFVSSVM